MFKGFSSIVNIANSLSVFRIFLAIPLYYSVNNMNTKSSLCDIYIFLFICFLIALSDVLDGYFARLFKSVTDIGKFLDPFADKVCVLVFILSLLIVHKIPEFLILFVPLLVRDLLISFFSIYFARKEGKFFQANIFGKWFLFFIAMSMIFAILAIPDSVTNIFGFHILFYIFYSFSWLFFILSTYKYFSKYINLLRK